MSIGTPFSSSNMIRVVYCRDWHELPDTKSSSILSIIIPVLISVLILVFILRPQMSNFGLVYLNYIPPYYLPPYNVGYNIFLHSL